MGDIEEALKMPIYGGGVQAEVAVKEPCGGGVVDIVHANALPPKSGPCVDGKARGVERNEKRRESGKELIGRGG